MADSPNSDNVETRTSAVDVGDVLGSYRIEHLLGVGGMGGVYRAVDTRLNRKVAIKVSHAPFNDRFEREARTLSSLNHPHICTLFDVGPNYLVMELIEGTTLATRIGQGPLPIEDAAQYGAQIADALEEAHRAGIVHRDLKPQNIMVTRHGMKVLDFGIAQVADETMLTKTGAIVGSVAYMAPEQREGRVIDARSDLYALGLILYEMTTGRRLEPGVPRQKLRSDLNRLVDDLLDADPAKRPQSAIEVAERLRAIGSTSRRATARVIAVAAAIVLIATVVTWWVVGSNRSQSWETASVAAILPVPGDKIDPAFSPDGRSIAFGWGGSKGDSPGIYVASNEGSDLRRLTHATGIDFSPAWSPDGREIAFMRRPTTGGLQVELMLASVRDGTERKLRDVQIPPSFYGAVTWSSDGKGLVVPMRDPETQFVSLFRVGLDDVGQRARRLLAGKNTNLLNPSMSRDGSWLAYVDDHSLRVQRLNAGEARGDPVDIMSEVSIGSPRWSPDSRTLFFLRPAVLQVMRWDASTHATDVVYASPVLPQAMDVTWADADTPRVVFSIAGGQLELRALNLEEDGRKARGQPQLLLRSAQSPSYSPDGRWIAFSRFFGGGVDLWLMDKDGRQMRRLTELHAKALRESSWSPDGRQIAFHARVQDKAEIFTLDIDPDAVMAAPSDAKPARAARRVVEAPFNLVSPQWSHDAKYLYVLRGELGHQMRVPVAGGELEDLFEAGAARVHPNEERIYYNRSDPPGVFTRSLSGNVHSNLEERVFADGMSPSGWTVTSRGVFYLATQSTRPPYPMRFFDFGRHESFELGATSRQWFSTLNVSPDGRRIVFDTNLETDGSMTMLQLRRRAN